MQDPRNIYRDADGRPHRRRPRRIGQTYPDVRCGDCGATMVLRCTDKYHYHDGRPRLFYGCGRFPDCRSIHGAHPDGYPLGVPADARTREARQHVHAVVAVYAQAHRLSMPEMYEFLAAGLEMDDDECHIGKFDLAQCRAAILLCAETEGHQRYADYEDTDPDAGTDPDGLGAVGDHDRPWDQADREQDVEAHGGPAADE
jgi:ssDNA-binding Zn-finger/Zn-ribbon topoisomerase 1